MIDVAKIAPPLRLGADGMWYGEAAETVSYPSEGNQACFEIEETSFWFNHRNACIVAAVGTFPPNHPGPIFDLGGGDGFVALGLIKAGFEVVLVEPRLSAATKAKKRGIPTVICATIGSAGFADATLDAVGLFDVLEHIDDDVALLRSVRSLLKPGGRLYATVPAYSVLWSDEDELAGHFRRYICSSMSDSVQRAGFRLDYSTYFFMWLPLPILLARAVPYRFGRSGRAGSARHTRHDHELPAGLAKHALKRLLSSEVRRITSRKRMAFGGSRLVVASVT